MSKASDVWAFGNICKAKNSDELITFTCVEESSNHVLGVLMWELLERRNPYPDMTNDQVIDFVCNR